MKNENIIKSVIRESISELLTETLEPYDYFQHVKKGDFNSVDFYGKQFGINQNMIRLSQEINQHFQNVECYPYVYKNDLRVLYALMLLTNNTMSPDLKQYLNSKDWHLYKSEPLPEFNNEMTLFTYVYRQPAYEINDAQRSHLMRQINEAFNPYTDSEDMPWSSYQEPVEEEKPMGYVTKTLMNGKTVKLNREMPLDEYNKYCREHGFRFNQNGNYFVNDKDEAIIWHMKPQYINEASNSYIVQKHINKIHKALHEYTSHIFKDNDWRYVKEAIDTIKQLGYEVEVSVKNGGYGNKEIDGMPRSKDYQLNIMTPDGFNINGILTCHAAGTMDNPFSSYDMTISLWRNKEALNEMLTNVNGLEMINKLIEPSKCELFETWDEERWLDIGDEVIELGNQKCTLPLYINNKEVVVIDKTGEKFTFDVNRLTRISIVNQRLVMWFKSYDYFIVTDILNPETVNKIKKIIGN